MQHVNLHVSYNLPLHYIPPIHVCTTSAGYTVLLYMIVCVHHLVDIVVQMYDCMSRHLDLFYILAGLPSNNPRHAYPDLETWDKVDPSVEDQAFLMEQPDRQ